MEVTVTPGKWLLPPPCLGETISHGTGEEGGGGVQGVIGVERVGDSSAVCSRCSQRSPIIASIYPLACVL